MFFLVNFKSNVYLDFIGFKFNYYVLLGIFTYVKLKPKQKIVGIFMLRSY